ncbi:MAG: DUF3048 domain-containing protein [Clostridiales bacterium]|nr:DUF3048 domain-containing protein [Clostridiales bacterium]
MKRLQVLLLVALSSALILVGCGKKEEVEEPVVAQVIEPQPELETDKTDAIEESATDDDVPPEEGMVRSTLTNEWIDGDLEDIRPISIMVPNDSAALPHYNLSKADILYECPVEGSITRSMAVIKDWDGLERIGNVRSCRDYFVYWSFEWDSIYLHFGGPFYIDNIVEREDTDHITGCAYGDKKTDGMYEGTFYRATDKKAPQNAYASAEGINKGIEKFGYSKTYRDSYYNPDHFKFASSKKPNTLEAYSDAITAKEVDMKPAYPVTKTSFTYNEEDGLYYRYMYGKPDVDAANNEAQLSFKNLLVQFTYHEVRDEKGYLAFQVHDTTRDGYYFTNGKGIHVTWKKTADYEPTKYYDDNGNEIQINTGKTMICVVEEGDSFNVDGTSLQSKAK